MGNEEIQLNFPVLQRQPELKLVLPQYGPIYVHELKGAEKAFRFFYPAILNP